MENESQFMEGIKEINNIVELYQEDSGDEKLNLNPRGDGSVGDKTISPNKANIGKYLDLINDWNGVNKH